MEIPHINSRNIQHIFWDWNGTLFDDAWLCRDVMNHMLRARDMPHLSETRYMEIFDFPVRSYYERIGFDFARESFDVLGMEFIQGYEARRHEAKLHRDVRTALDRVRTHGRGQSILSAYQHDTLVRLVGEQGLDTYFHDLHGHHDHYAEGKIPQGQRALTALGLPPGQTVLIGDTAHDAEVAHALGMACILIPGGNQPLQRLIDTGCPVVDSRNAALDLIFQEKPSVSG